MNTATVPQRGWNLRPIPVWRGYLLRPIVLSGGHKDILWKLARIVIALQPMIPSHDSNRFQHHGRNTSAAARVVATQHVKGALKGGKGMVTLDFASHAQAWLTAWNAHDLERILAHYSENLELISPFVAKLTGQSEGVVRGKAALRDYFARGLQAFPTLRFDFIRLYSGVRSCVLEYHSVNDQRTAEVMEFDEQGKVRRVLAYYSVRPQSQP